MSQDKKAITKHIITAILKISIIGVFIGYFHQYHQIIAVLVAAKVIYELVSKVILKNNRVLLMGMLITGAIGSVSEHIGVTYGYWEYHDVTNYIPYWVPFAWMSAFTFLYKLESRVFPLLTNKKSRLIYTASFILLFPTLGEIITINLGVWTYHIPYKILGIPLLAIFGLCVIHTGVDAFLKHFSKKYNLADVVYNK